MSQSRCGFAPRIGALSGPSFAKEVARGDPTAITVASTDAELAETVQREFSDPRFRVYTNDDVVGVELGGALKNIIAIAAGVCDGLGLGHNSIAALITRGLAEITRLAVACGGRRETMAGLAGLGDLVLTCTGGLSRNRSVGVELGRGRKLPTSSPACTGRSRKGSSPPKPRSGWLGLMASKCRSPNRWMPFCIVPNSPAEAIHDLMTRSVKSEATVYSFAAPSCRLVAARPVRCQTSGPSLLFTNELDMTAKVRCPGIYWHFGNRHGLRS